MNYQFIRDISGQALAKFDMGGETFAQWFSEELGNDKAKIDALLHAIEQLNNKQINTFELPGKEIHLRMNADEVEAVSKYLDNDDFESQAEDLPEGTQVYDQESASGCGLEDFAQVLASWKDFI
jgi:uncharacterized protein YacL (UPF0231 family)